MADQPSHPSSSPSSPSQAQIIARVAAFLAASHRLAAQPKPIPRITGKPRKKLVAVEPLRIREGQSTKSAPLPTLSSEKSYEGPIRVALEEVVAKKQPEMAEEKKKKKKKIKEKRAKGDEETHPIKKKERRTSEKRERRREEKHLKKKEKKRKRAESPEIDGESTPQGWIRGNQHNKKNQCNLRRKQH
ncbi:protein PXR1-like [Benincasa hispida]|uniref:protein PXR1-like n=1 Tax=Benincasa hispida TaxID=102211 RepID=UPI0018FFCC2F|nr:protein PXR1-like [Benincasa hispida]